jgi:DNA-binding response OmpR family regulator
MKGKVLIIEDDPNWQDDLKEFLEFDGFHVEIAADITTAIKKVTKERFHFITLDMRLDKDSKENLRIDEFEGWDVLDVIKRLRVEQMTPVMVVTSYPEDYEEYKHIKGLESLFYMGKKAFDKRGFLEIVNREVARIDLRFNNDYRDS